MIEIEEVFISKTYSEDEIYIDVYAIVTTKRSIPDIMELIHEEVSLSRFGLQHLKRIQPYHRSKCSDLVNFDKDRIDDICFKDKVKILLCPVSYYHELKPNVLDLCTEKEIIRVCRLQPETREEFEEWNKPWPINFHIKQSEKDREKGLTKNDLEQVQYVYQHILNNERLQTKILLNKQYNSDSTIHLQTDNIASNVKENKIVYDKKYDLQLQLSHLENVLEQQHHDQQDINLDSMDSNVAIIMNPMNNKIVMTSWDALAFMKSTTYSSQHKNDSNNNNNNNRNYNNKNIENLMNNNNTDDDVLSTEEKHFLSDSLLFTSIYTPTMLCIEGVAAIVRGELVDVHDSLPDNFYLCSGLDLYLFNEPDLMSSFALVHSRIRRVFYRYSNKESGALESGRGHIHTLKSLNHHYRVFKVKNLPDI